MAAMTDRALQRNQDWRVVTIKEVNPATHHIQAEDSLGTPLMIDTTGQEPFLQIPVVGEVWTVSRRGSDWLLDARYEPQGVTTPFTNLNPGEARVEAPGTIWMNTPKVTVSGNEEIKGNLTIDGDITVVGSYHGITPGDIFPSWIKPNVDEVIGPDRSLVVGSSFEIASGHTLEIGLGGNLTIV